MIVNYEKNLEAMGAMSLVVRERHIQHSCHSPTTSTNGNHAVVSIIYNGAACMTKLAHNKHTLWVGADFTLVCEIYLLSHNEIIIN